MVTMEQVLSKFGKPIQLTFGDKGLFSDEQFLADLQTAVDGVNAQEQGREDAIRNGEMLTFRGMEDVQRGAMENDLTQRVMDIANQHAARRKADAARQYGGA